MMSEVPPIGIYRRTWTQRTPGRPGTPIMATAQYQRRGRLLLTPPGAEPQGVAGQVGSRWDRLAIKGNKAKYIVSRE